MENETAQPETSLESSTEQPQSSPEPTIVDLDKQERIRWNGQEWSTKDLMSGYMRQSDYSRKTQALAEERKYYDNLSYDLEAVKQNPALAAQFRQLYPQKFHNYLRYLGVNEQPQNAGQNNNQSVDPQFLHRFEALERDMNERKIMAIESDLDSKFKVLSQKYPFAHEEAVIARAEAALDKGIKLTNEVWDKLWKTVDEQSRAIAKKYYSQLVNNQRSANSRGRDIGGGGGTPQSSPRAPRTIKEASEHALRELEQTG